ncbi:MAG: nucleotidyltransferase domain-containing protein [Candidatus Bathyarchaeia archaeon]
MPRDGVSLIDLQLHAQEERQRYLTNIDHYLDRIKEVTREEDPNSRILVFGSYVKGAMRIDSDVDVLIITHLAEDTEERIKLRVRIAREVGVYSPFEFHIATREEYNSWYKTLIDEHREI